MNIGDAAKYFILKMRDMLFLFLSSSRLLYSMYPRLKSEHEHGNTLRGKNFGLLLPLASKGEGQADADKAKGFLIIHSSWRPSRFRPTFLLYHPIPTRRMHIWSAPMHIYEVSVAVERIGGWGI